MRLLHAQSGELHEFLDREAPAYAILSHTWVSGQEVTFQDLQKPLSAYEHRLGWAKITGFCNEVLRTSALEWVWVDTCCIDKSSSAELQEAINSMFQWYRRASRCSVYMADVPPSNDYDTDGSAFRRSRWFTRGWTLQELIAPRTITFYNSEWQIIARLSPEAHHFRKLLHEISGIQEPYLPCGVRHRQRRAAEASIAQRMSWVAKRQTARAEDMAYCLLGLMNVNIPMIYGEGDRAFTRLQAEVVKVSGDQTFLAFAFAKPIHYSPLSDDECGIFVTSPRDFAHCGTMSHQPFESKDELVPFEVTNLGLRISVEALEHRENLIVFLRSDVNGRKVALPLYKSHVGRNGYYRAPFCRPALVSRHLLQYTTLQSIYIQDHQVASHSRRPLAVYRVAVDGPLMRDFELIECYPPQALVPPQEPLPGFFLHLDAETFLCFRERATEQRVVLRIAALPQESEDLLQVSHLRQYESVSANQPELPSCALAYIGHREIGNHSKVKQDRFFSPFSLLNYVAYMQAVGSNQDPLEWCSEVRTLASKRLSIRQHLQPLGTVLCLEQEEKGNSADSVPMDDNLPIPRADIMIQVLHPLANPEGESSLM